jgi:hypothetical protein
MAPTLYQTHFSPGNDAGTLDFPCFMSPDPVSRSGASGHAGPTAGLNGTGGKVDSCSLAGFRRAWWNDGVTPISAMKAAFPAVFALFGLFWPEMALPGVAGGSGGATGGLPDVTGGSPRQTGDLGGATGGSSRRTGGFGGAAGGSLRRSGGFGGAAGDSPRETGGFGGAAGGFPREIGGSPRVIFPAPGETGGGLFSVFPALRILPPHLP